MCMDRGQVRRMEDEAQDDPTMRDFIGDMLTKLRTPLTESRQLFDIYSEALIYRPRRERCGDSLSIEKIDDPSRSNPDFKCRLVVDHNGRELPFDFYIEVKSASLQVRAPGKRKLTETKPDEIATGFCLDGLNELRANYISTGGPHARHHMIVEW